ncbi:prolyl oligopeptidase family protein [Flavobacterium sp. 90]|uniref:alpha/beta hydrolase family protein n=1 Tax=unclassified Flavobacterium TaxID=196869 RepID=UPI000EAE194C|nr:MULTISPECIES: prolyl oligopeptidase family serine peptidase [unclassified Flavobacterium]RKR12026.1 prolyl oligopeptidase family protein [Flavobacterium sp. 81]TCK55798.1 prolyl oligopeptidase family protein [Flavobacterium sp. 90]
MKKILLLCALVLSVHSLSAQKKALDEATYDQWKRVGNKALSYNGKWISYSTVFQDENKENTNQLIIQEAPKGKRLVLNNVNDLKFIGKKDWIQYSVNDSTFLQNLKSGVKKLWKSQHYTSALEGTDFLYYTRPEASKGNFFLQRLVCYNLETNDSLSIKNIKASRFIKNNKAIVYVQIEDGKVFLKHGIPGGKQETIYSGKAEDFGDFQLNSNENGGTFTLKGNNSADFNLVYYFNMNTNSVNSLFNYDDITLNDPAFSISKSAYGLDENSSIIQLQVNSNQRPENTQIPRSEIEVWKSMQGTMERRQELLRNTKTLPSEQKFLYDIKNKKVIKAASTGEFDQLAIPESGNFKGFFGMDKKPYTVEVDWTFNERNDIYWIDAQTGKSTKVLTGVFGSVSWNPQGTFAVMYDEKQKAWTIFDPNTLQFKNISSQINFPIFDENVDMTSLVTAYGIAGWLNNGNTIVIYDQFDMWAIDLTNKKAPYSLTQGYGRKNNVELRYSESGYIGDLDQKKSFNLIGFDNVHKSKGVYKFANNTITKVSADANYNTKIEATSGDNSTVLFTKESYTIFPDLWWATSAFGSQQKITDVNPQQKEYAWGTSKLITWKDFNGKENQGNLYLPENYDSKKTYPVIVHFYEKHTEEFNVHHLPEVSTSNINIPTYVSKGYIVFQPDVHYVYGAPGNSVYNDVVSGVEYLIASGITEKGKIGIQGHSFGGYETSFLTTKTDVFSCAIVGSGVSNFTANYPVMRSNGISTMFKYEADQYRMGSSLHDNLEGYIKNSPLFSAKNIKTPILIFHNDNDRAVPYQEGQSLFFALRRLGKPAWLVNYKKEGHTLEDAGNKKDWTNKMQQYFDYYLKGADRPSWM